MNQSYLSEYNGYLIALPKQEFELAVRQYRSGYTRWLEWRNRQAVKLFN